MNINRKNTNATIGKRFVLLCIVLACIFILESCASLQAYMIVLSSDYDGETVLENEKDVRFTVEQMYNDASQYTMKAFERKAISYEVKKTETTTHSFYLITREDFPFQTLSFSATGKWATSVGAWAMNTETDVSSYEAYLSGENIWEVSEIKTQNGINTKETLGNVLTKMQSDTTYYFKSKANKDDKIDNCNSALLETLAEN
jgi:hypothetical protein